MEKLSHLGVPFMDTHLGAPLNPANAFFGCLVLQFYQDSKEIIFVSLRLRGFRVR